MIKKTTTSPKDTLRLQAEERLSKQKEKTQPLKKEDTSRLVHELRVHRIELEMQNEELARLQTESEATLNLYAELYAFAPVGYFTLTRDGTIRRVNLTGAKLMDGGLSDLINRRLGVFIAPESRTTFSDFLDRVFISKNKETCEIVFQKKGTDVFWAHVEAVCESAHGQPEMCYAIVSDITARKQAEEKLKQQAVWVQFVSDAVIITDLNLHITDWNTAAAHIYGWNAGEAAGRMVDELLKTEFISMAHTEAQTILKQTGLWQGQIRQQTKSGQWLEVDTAVTFIKDGAGNITGSIIVNRDVTERKQAEQKIHDQAGLLAQVNDAVIASDENFMLTFWNKGAETIFGWKADEVIGKHSMAVLHTEFEQTTRSQALQQLKENGECWTKVTQLRKDGTRLAIEAHTVSLFDDNGKITGYVSINRDITARKQAEESLRIAEADYRAIVENMPDGFTYCEMRFDDNDSPTDFTYLAVNNAFETLTGLKNVTGRRASEVIPHVWESDPELLEICGRVSKTGKPERFEMFINSLQMKFGISVYSPRRGYFAAVFERSEGDQ